MIGPSPGLARSEQRWMRTARHWRSSDVSDGAGGVVRSWLELEDGTPAVFGIPSPSERATAEQEGVDYDYNVKVPADADVRRGDRLRLGAVDVEVVSDAVSSSTASKILRGRAEPWDEPTPSDTGYLGAVVADLILEGVLE